MQSCAVALGRHGIRANALLPGTIATDINRADLADAAKYAGMVSRTALGRLGGTSRRVWADVDVRLTA
jgi:L-rhamnose 1-dehydrogenase